jgi:Phosphate-selective porin O and P
MRLEVQAVPGFPNFSHGRILEEKGSIKQQRGKFVKTWPALALVAALVVPANAQEFHPTPSIAELESKLDQAVRDMKTLSGTIESLRSELDSLKQSPPHADDSVASGTDHELGQAAPEPSKEAADEFTDRIVGPDLGQNERDHTLGAKPEIFIQTRYSVAPIEGSEAAFDPNFRISRAEVRWAGKIADRIGAGVEMQYQEAPDGTPDRLLNDAFLEYYFNTHATVRAGQFVKPFGFDVEQASAVRESPERAVFSGYFFPGERDRGVMLSGDLGFLSGPPFKDLQYFVGVFNGNRFFNDNNRQVNYMARVRKHFDKKLAVGASMQLGKQVLPPGVSGNDNERIFGLDVQFAAGRFGIRGEAVAGNMPSTSVAFQPVFFPAFRPGAHSTAGALFVGYRIAGNNNVYARYNQFNGDPVTGKNVRTVNIGYFRPISRLSRLNVDYQFKNRPSFEDDAINGRFQITWQIFLGKPSEESSGKMESSSSTGGISKEK